MKTSLAILLEAGLLGLSGVSAASIPYNTGCSKSLPAGQSPGNVYNHTIVSNGISRYYLVFIPPEYSTWDPNPLILSYHGGLNTAEDQLQLDLFTSPYFNNKSMVVYPQGIDDTWQGVPGVTTNDVLFTSDILNQVQATYCVDSTHIFGSGKSDGAGFVGNVAACDAQLSQRFAAMAPVSGAFYVHNTSVCAPSTIPIPCNNSRPVPMYEFHGGMDPVINYEGGPRKGECLPTIPHWITQWAVRDGLGPQNRSSPLAPNTTHYSWGTGWRTGFVQQTTDFVIGHDWPSTQPNADNTFPGQHPASFNATPLILDFFQQHPLLLDYLEDP